MIVFGLKNCDSCRPALKALTGARLIDVRADGMPEAVLDRALAQFGTDLVNARSTTWRGLSDAERDRDPKTLLLAHPALMKRPLIAVEDQLFLGWSKGIEADIKAISDSSR